MRGVWTSPPLMYQSFVPKLPVDLRSVRAYISMRRRYISLFNYESKYFSLYNCNVFKILVGICACSPMHWIELYSFEIQPCHLCFCAMPAQSRPVGCLPHFAGELASIMFQGAMACLGLTVVSERAHCLAGSQPGAVFKCGCFLS